MIRKRRNEVLNRSLKIFFYPWFWVGLPQNLGFDFSVSLMPNATRIETASNTPSYFWLVDLNFRARSRGRGGRVHMPLGSSGGTGRRGAQQGLVHRGGECTIQWTVGLGPVEAGGLEDFSAALCGESAPTSLFKDAEA